MSESPASDEPAIQPADQAHRDPTGCARLDDILGGGIQRGAVALVVGAPASGKTTIAAQMAFAAAHDGRQCLIVTALSEPTTRLIPHLRTFSFFDDAMLGTRIQVVAIGEFFTQGLENIVLQIVAEARKSRATLVVIDGFRGLRFSAHEPARAHYFLYDLGTQLSTLGATTVITLEAEPRESSMFSEVATADVLIGAYHTLVGGRQRRAIEAIKVRGASPMPGLHGMTITREGVTVYPRLEARVVAAAAQDHPDDRQETGADRRAAFAVPELDALLGGGLSAATATLLVGGPGTGKTLLSLQFLHAGLLAGEPGALLGFHETERELLKKAAPFAFGEGLRRALAPGGGLSLLRQPPVERDADILADLLLTELDRVGARRLVIDGLHELERAVAETSDSGRMPNYVTALLEALRVRGITTLLVRESGYVIAPTITMQAPVSALIAANVIWLQQISVGAQLHRIISVPKMRYSRHDVNLHEFAITPPKGVHILGQLASDSIMLSALQHHNEERSGNF